MTELSRIEEKIKKLFSYWDELPQMIILNDKKFKKSTQEVRKQINHSLLIGLDDKEPGTNKIRKRHVLNAKEIKEITEKYLGRVIENANLYFHLNELEKIGLIQVVDAIPIKGKKRYESYYGRTAKMFLLDVPDERQEYPILYDDKFFSIIQKLNPDYTKKEYTKIMNKLKRIDKLKSSTITDWFQENEVILNDADLDLSGLFGLISFLNRFDKNVIEAFGKMAKLLNFERDTSL